MDISYSFSTKNPDILKLKERSGELFDIGAATSLLHWDQETYMPPRGIIHRGQQLATLSAIYHQKLTDKEVGVLVHRLSDEVGERPEKYSVSDKALVREMKRAYDNATKIPEKLVKDIAHATSTGLESWKKARKEKQFLIFADSLEQIIKLKAEEANCLGYKDSPYDALLDQYEPDLTAKKVAEIFTPLGLEVSSLLKKIQSSGRSEPMFKLKEQNFSVTKAQRVTEKILEKIGYDFSAGRQDLSTHPFTINFGHGDVRVTNRFSPQDLSSSIFTAIHEGGHALYELGIHENLARSALAGGTSLGIHESQSRFWENLIGRTKEFWEYWLPYLKKTFPQINRLDPNEAYRQVNWVKPGYIRVEADEVTYNLHIIIRFEIEKDLVEGKIKVSDVPEIWNQKMKKYLGITPPDDSLGVLQDIHWSQGSIGYFPTYTLGNLYSAQIYKSMVREIGDVRDHVASGNFYPILDWLREKIHRHGSVFRAEELIHHVSGESLNPDYFLDYLKRKYAQLYFHGS